MDYEPVSTSELTDRAPPQLSLVDKTLRQLHLFRRPHNPSSYRRWFRYIAFAFLLLVIWTLLLPRYSTDSTDTRHDSSDSPFHIQSTSFKENSAAKKIRIDRQQQVREAFLHAWKGYKKHAWLHDEVAPLTGGLKDPFVGWAATLVDGLDSLHIMGLQEEFDDALLALETIDFSKPNAERIPVFETTIRYLGGLLGAYDVSGAKHPILLEKADQLGEMLFRAFNTRNGIPQPYYWWQKSSEKLDGDTSVVIAQIGSLSLEFTRLAQLTGKHKYFDGISIITNYLDDAQNNTQIPGLWPTQVNTIRPSFDGSYFSLGALADSLYEYLPKEHLLLGGQNDQYLRMYRTALDSATKYHFFHAQTPGNQDILFTGSLTANSGGDPYLNAEFQHLGCFVGGMVGLGARISNSPSELRTAIQLTDSCVWAYANTASGIMPEISHVEACPSPSSPCLWTDDSRTELGHQYGFRSVDDSSYQLRPEAIESVFIMYRITGDPEWQEKGWRMFQAIIKHTRTSIANARLGDVTSEHPQQEDSMESFWLAETLKYFFLLFSEPGLVSLDDFVLNTEAHPFRQRDHLFAI